jgi:hypothetical protein
VAQDVTGRQTGLGSDGPQCDVIDFVARQQSTRGRPDLVRALCALLPGACPLELVVDLPDSSRATHYNGTAFC